MKAAEKRRWQNIKVFRPKRKKAKIPKKGDGNNFLIKILYSNNASRILEKF